MTVGIEKGRDTGGCKGWPFWGGTIRNKAWIIQKKKKKKSQSFKELDIKREQMQKLRAEISFEIFEEQKAHYGSNLMNKRLNERR